MQSWEYCCSGENSFKELGTAQTFKSGVSEISIFRLFMLKVFFSDIAAFPDSVNILDDVSGDIRTPDKLIDRVNDTTDGRHMWLAPVLPGLVHFPFPFCPSHVWGWNWKHGGKRKQIEFRAKFDFSNRC